MTFSLVQDWRATHPRVTGGLSAATKLEHWIDYAI